MRREGGNMLAEWIEKIPSLTRNTLKHVLGVYSTWNLISHRKHFTLIRNIFCLGK